MRPFTVLVFLPSLQIAFAAAPTASKTLSVGETTGRQVRASKEHVAVEVQPNGHIAEAPHEKIQASTARIEAKPHKAVEEKIVKEEAAIPKAQPAPAQKAKAHVEAKPDGIMDKIMDFEKQAVFIHMAEAEESWKSAFFFFASLVLFVSLAAGCLYQMKKKQDDQKAESTRATSSASGSSATKLQSHLNDSSSTSDSGEKIAMLFDRVRQSLEDLSHEKGPATTGPGDVAGGKGGQI